MSIETYFPTAKGGFFDSFLGGSNSGNNHTSGSQMQLNLSSKSLKPLPTSILTGNQLLAVKSDSVKKEYRSLDRVLKNEYAPPFSRKEFAQFLEEEGQKTSFLFIKSVEEYVKYSAPLFPLYKLESLREAKKITHKRNDNPSLLRKIGSSQSDLEAKKAMVSAPMLMTGFELPKGPASLTTQNYVNLVASLQEMGSKIGNQYVLEAENELNLPENIIKSFQEVYDRAELHPKIFEQAYHYVFDRLEQGPFVDFLKQRRKMAAEVPGYTVKDIILKSTPSPYSYEDFFTFLSTKGAQKELEFLNSAIEYQNESEQIYPHSLMQMNNAKDLPFLVSGSSPLTSAVEIMSVNQLVPNSSFLIPLELTLQQIKKPDSMSLEEFKNKKTVLETRLKLIIDTYISNTSTINILPEIQKEIMQHYNAGSHHPDLLYQLFEIVSNNLRVDYLTEFLETQHQIAKLNESLESTIPSYTSAVLLNDEALPPYSRRDFLSFIHKTDRAQFYLEFLNDLKEHEKSCKIFFSYNCNTRLEFRPSPDELDSFLQEVKADALAEPMKPDGMSDAEFSDIKKILVNNAKFIFESYLYYDAKKRLFDLTNESIDYISKCLIQDNCNPLVFMREKLAGEVYFETKIVSHFLKATYEEKLERGIAYKFSKKVLTKMEKVLIDEAESPFSYNSFFEYCAKQEATEGLELLKSILKYVQNAYPIFTDSIEGPPKAPKQPSTMSDSEYLSLCLSLKAQCKAIFEKYIGFTSVVTPRPILKSLPIKKDLGKNSSNESLDSPEDTSSKGQTFVEFLSNLERCDPTNETTPKSDAHHVKLPEAIRKPLMAARENELYNPNIFSRVYDYFYTQIENKVWNGYEKYTDPAGIYASNAEEEPKITIRQLALDELASPFSYQEYSNFLQTQLCHEAIEFLRDCYVCQIAAEPLYEIRLIKQNSNNVQTLADKYIPSPLKPNTIPEATFKKFLSMHQNTFKDIVEKYIYPGSPSEVNLPVKCRKPFLKLYEDGYSHPEMLNELIEHISDMLKLNNFQKFLKQASEAAATASRKTNIDEITIRHLVLNTLPSPFSTKDFMNYLKNESCPEGLEFLLSIVAYHAFALPFYPDITHDRESENFKQIKFQCRSLAETYMYPGSPKHISALTDSIKKKLRIELVKENFHPEIWKPSFEAVAQYLQKDKMSRFLKKAIKS